MAEQLKGKRTALKGWVTRLTAQLTELCSDDRPDIEILADSITQLQSKLNNLDTVQSEIESKLPASELDADLEEAFNFKQKARLIKIKASSFLHSEINRRERSQAWDGPEGFGVERTSSLQEAES